MKIQTKDKQVSPTSFCLFVYVLLSDFLFFPASLKCMHLNSRNINEWHANTFNTVHFFEHNFRNLYTTTMDLKWSHQDMIKVTLNERLSALIQGI